MFLVCDDYGMGGLWGVMMARSEQEILEKYPELVVVDERPAWMTIETYERIWDNEMHDIDGVPWGMLNGIMADREKRRGDRGQPGVGAERSPQGSGETPAV